MLRSVSDEGPLRCRGERGSPRHTGVLRLRCATTQDDAKRTTAGYLLRRIVTPPLVVVARTVAPPAPSVVVNCLTADPSLDRHREIDVHAAVHRARLEHRRVVRRDRETHAAVRRAQIEAAADPPITRQLGVDAAVHGAAMHVALHVVQRQAAVFRFGADASTSPTRSTRRRCSPSA